MNRAAQIAAVASASLIGIVGGYGWQDITRGRLPQIATIPQALSGKAVPTAASEPYVEFLQTLSAIDARFYGEPDRQKLLRSAVAGMMDSLKDPYTIYMEPEQAEHFRESSSGAFIKTGGIGAELLPDPLGPRVKHVFKGGPAAESGVLPEDIVIKVNGETTAGKDVSDVVSKIRGEPGTTVHLTFFRASSNKTFDLTITRKLAEIQDVYGSVLQTSYTKNRPPIGYVEYRKFSGTAVDQFDGEIAELMKRHIKGLIIDLRGNPGGLMNAAVDLCSRFFEQELVASMRPRTGETESYFAPTGKRLNLNCPIVLLVDAETASAAEIFAGAMKDYKLATLVGDHTYGKGAVQKGYALPDAATAKITIGKYYLPMGESVNRVVDENNVQISGGIQPHVKVIRKPGTQIGSPETDDQLRTAVKVILSKIG